jgi:hypothetical protein
VKNASIYKSNERIIIITQCKVEDGFLLSSEPVILLENNCHIADFLKAILISLNASVRVLPTPLREEYPLISKRLKKLYKVKSYKELYSNYRNVHIRLEDNNLTVFPSIFYNKTKPSRGLVTYEKGIKVFSDFENNQLEIAQCIIDMLDIDYKAMQLNGELEG